MDFWKHCNLNLLLSVRGDTTGGSAEVRKFREMSRDVPSKAEDH